MSKVKPSTGYGLLAAIERIGNRLPDPVTLFVIGAALVLVGSELAHRLDWVVINPTTQAEERVISLCSSAGMQWVWQNLISNFTGFAPLGVVLVGMIGIGVAERSGLIGTLLKAMVSVTPQSLITPSVLFVGVMSSMALDAGYIVLPPLAAAVFARSGRSPLVGLAAVFAGVAAGFSANLAITGLDPLLQSFTQESAQILNPDYQVDIRCNYYFMIVSTFLITLVGWAVTRFVVEPKFTPEEVADQIRLSDAATASSSEDPNTVIRSQEILGLVVAFACLAVASIAILAMILIDGAPLNGQIEPRPGWKLDVWVSVIVPILLVLFLIPGLGYGIAVGTIRSDRDVAKMMSETMRSMGPYIVLAFFAAQFVSWFGHSNLGKMIALEGVAALQQLPLPPFVYVLAVVLLSAVLNIFIGSASAKWALISTVFVPIFMGVGVSPELTQAAYRVGDSVTNSIAPLNPYLVIILVFMQKYKPRAGLGSLIALMLPYTLAFTIAWCILLSIWMALGIPLGPDHAPLFIEPISSATSP